MALPPCQVEAALHQQQEPHFGDLLTVVRPAGQRLIEDKEGHKLVRWCFEVLACGPSHLRVKCCHWLRCSELPRPDARRVLQKTHLVCCIELEHQCMCRLAVLLYCRHQNT